MPKDRTLTERLNTRVSDGTRQSLCVHLRTPALGIAIAASDARQQRQREESLLRNENTPGGRNKRLSVGSQRFPTHHPICNQCNKKEPELQQGYPFKADKIKPPKLYTCTTYTE